MSPLLPCPFCGSSLVKSEVFSTRSRAFYVHPETADYCPANDFRCTSDDPERCAAWNRRAAPADGWLPIESAPRDFTPFIGWRPGGVRQWYRWVDDRHSGTGWYNSEQGRVTDQPPTHWHSLPSPPLSAKDTTERNDLARDEQSSSSVAESGSSPPAAAKSVPQRVLDEEARWQPPIGIPSYEDAVGLVRAFQRPSTSFVQRKLQLGYNRAASFIEQMEADGICTAADHTGKRHMCAPAAAKSDNGKGH
jgi:hypothetical protein